MTKVVNSGDVVLSKAGRDKGKCFLVVSVNGKIATIVDGRNRKVNFPKKKNIKHLEVLTAGLKVLSEKIRNGKAVGNEIVYRAVKTEKQKIQED